MSQEWLLRHRFPAFPPRVLDLSTEAALWIGCISTEKHRALGLGGGVVPNLDILVGVREVPMAAILHQMSCFCLVSEKKKCLCILKLILHENNYLLHFVPIFNDELMLGLKAQPWAVSLSKK